MFGATLMLCHCFHIMNLVNSECDTLHHRKKTDLQNLIWLKRNKLPFCPFSLRHSRKEWTHGKDMPALWRNSSYLFLSLLTSLITTSCLKGAMANQNIPLCLVTGSNIPRRPLDEPKSPPTQMWPSFSTDLHRGGCFLARDPRNEACRMFHESARREGSKSQKHSNAATKKRQHVMFMETESCIDYHVKQQSWEADLKTSQQKNADMRSVPVGLWFRTEARGNSEWALKNEYDEARMNKAPKARNTVVTESD